MLKRSTLLAILLALPTSQAFAQMIITPSMGSSATESAVGAEDAQEDVRQVLVIGDALGGGLGAGLARYAEAHGGFAISNRFVEESGISRPEVYDWSATLPKILEGKDYDQIVVLMGSNDRQMIRQDNLRVGFEAPEWTEAYKRNLERVLVALKSSGAEIFWISLPPMANPDYDAAISHIAGLQKAGVEEQGFHYIDIRPAFLGANGQYTDTGPDDTGEVRKLRSRDGVTFFKQGNNRMAQIVAEALAKETPPVAAATPKTPVDAPRAKLVIPDVVVPVFGQSSVDGTPLLVEPKEVATAMVSATTDSFSLPSGSFSDVLAMTPPGSAAARLFTEGTVAVVPSGRLDDFSTSQPAENKPR